MERARHRKSKSASGIEGLQQIQKQKAIPRLSTDSRSYIDGSKRDDMFMLELGQSPLQGATGIPMKKLLAEEMSKEVESKRRSPSVIARLMGLEGLPSPRHVYGQQKRLSESYQQKNASINIKSKSQRYDGRTNRSSMDQQEFKDVYEDLEASHVVNRRCSSRWSVSSILTKPEMALIQQKFIDAKRVSTDEKLQWHPDGHNSLFVKHLYDQQVDPGNTLGNHIAVLKPSNSEKYENKAKAWRSKRDTSSEHFHVTSHLKREDGLLLEPHSRHRAHISRNSSRIQLEAKNEENILPTRIVVLKPNLGSSPDLSNGYQPSFKKIKEYPSVETVSQRRKDSSRDVGLSKPISKEAREIAREITMRMRDGCDETLDSRSIAYRGYVGDESSYDASESESEEFKLSCRKSFDENNIRKSSVNREARKRLSERWKMTHKYQNLEVVVSKGSTLGEMLALPDRETRPGHLNAKTTSLVRASNYRLGSNNGNGPSGISSRDGWMDEITKSSSRSKSLPPSTGGRGRSHKRSTYHDELAEDKNLMHNETVHCGRSKFVKKSLSHKEDYSSKYSKSRGKKPHPCQDIFVDGIDSSSEANFEIQMEANIKDVSEQQSIFEMSAKADTCKNPVVDVMMISEAGSTTLSSELIQKQSSLVIDGDECAAHEQEDCSFQELDKVPSKHASSTLPCLGAEPESSESYKEADHPSPISVLQVPFTEDTSSSESFERVSAELQELRLQLQLLKMESNTDADESTLFPIGEEEMQPSPVVSEGDYLLGPEGWEYSYALDVLNTSGLQESDFNMFRTSWYSPDCPLDPKLYDNLEKQYGDLTTGTRSERRLLFDRINSALLQIFVEHFDSCPWVMPKLTGLNMKWQTQGVRDAVEKLIDRELSNVEISDKVIDREMQWLDCKAEIEMIGNEIEKLLINDMIDEVLYVCN